MKKLAIFGYTPREEVMVNTVRRDMPGAEIALFSGIPNKALEERVDHVHGIADKDLLFLKNWGADVVVIGPDKFSSLGIRERLVALGIEAIVGADSQQVQFETNRASLRTIFPELRRFFPTCEVFNSWDPQAIRACLRNYGRYAVKYNGVFEQIGGGTKLSGLHFRDEGEALSFAQKSIAESGRVVVERQVSGVDFSVNAITAGDGSIFFYPENYCYKLREAGNLGPNTSGTGSFAFSSHLPFMNPSQQEAARDICREVVERVNHRGPNPLISGLNFDFRLGDDGNIYLFEMNTRFAGAGTLSTVMDLTANSFIGLLENAVHGSFCNVKAATRAPCAVAVFTYPTFFPVGPDRECVVQIPKATALSVNCYTGWVQVVSDTDSSRSVQLKNSTTQLFQAIGSSPADCRSKIYPILARMPAGLEYRKDIGEMEVPFLQLMNGSARMRDIDPYSRQPRGRPIDPAHP